MRDPADQLLEDGLIRRDGERTRTTPRWQAAMARAALGLQRAEVALDLGRIRLAREVEPACHPADVRVHREGVRGAEVHEHHARRLPPDARQRLEPLARAVGIGRGC